MDRRVGPGLGGGGSRVGFGPRDRAVLHHPDRLQGRLACASFCSSVIEQGRSERDFIELAAYQLGAPQAIDLPPANMSMPAPVDPKNVYAGTGAGMFSPAVGGRAAARLFAQSHHRQGRRHRSRDVQGDRQLRRRSRARSTSCRPGTCRRCGCRATSAIAAATPTVMPIDPKTGKLGKAIDVPDSYNIYFTPDGRSAIIVAEAMRRLEFRDPHTMALQGYIATPRCAGINHADFSPDGSYAIFTCEYSDALAKIDLVHHTLAGMLQLSPGGIPQDIRISPDGSVFFVADMLKDGLVVDRRRCVPADRLHQDRRRRARPLPVPRRKEALCRQPRHPQPRRRQERRGQRQRGRHVRAPRDLATWTIPGGGSPDMGNVSRRRQMAVALGPLRRRRSTPSTPTTAR